jgi:mono/diheme cytochrome c family protein
MKRSRLLLLLALVAIFAFVLYGAHLVRRGFTTANEPSRLEAIVARAARNFAIPRKARLERNPWKATPDALKVARESYFDRCAVCHAPDGSGQTNVGGNLYPRVPDLRAPQTQNLTDGQLRYIIRSGVPLTGMPGWAKPHDEDSDDSWKLVLYIRSLRDVTDEERKQQADTTSSSAHYTGSAACKKMPRANLRTLA